MKSSTLFFATSTLFAALAFPAACGSGDKGDDDGAGSPGGQGGATSAGGSSAGGSESGGQAPGSGGSGEITCELVDESCTSDEQCCSEFCDAASNTCSCGPMGRTCASGADCCSGQCNPESNTCAQNLGTCAQEDTPCENGTECCSLSCVDGQCSGSACVQDTQTCSQDGECCSGICESGSCKAANSGSGQSCLGSGNSCSDAGDCCSGLCTEGLCAIGSSYCVQRFDVCSSDSQCCQGLCIKEDGAAAGYCGENETGGTNCGKEKLAAGELCGSDCSKCCSRTCAPYGPSGVNVCQPATGCRPDGELCRDDLDCCGGNPDSSIPGAGQATCEKANPDDEVGKCKVGGCNPHGSICGSPDNGTAACDGSLSAPNGQSCCGKNALPNGVNACSADSLLVPRCDVLQVECPRDPADGNECATADDCCDGNPCVQDEEGVFRCFDPPGGSCVEAGGPCTASADCCVGSLCIQEPGEATGVCGQTKPPGSGGSPGTGGSSMGGSGGTPTVCAAYGQSCAESACCSGIPCDALTKTCRFGSGG